MRQVLEMGSVEVTEGGVNLGYFVKSRNCGVIGNYDGRVKCGCDRIRKPEEVVRRVHLFARRFRHVLLEGILVAHSFKRYNSLALEVESTGKPYYFAFLDTPLELCLERLRARREEGSKPLDTRYPIRDWHRIWERIRSQCEESGRRVLVLDHKDPLPTVMEVLSL